MRPHTNRFPLIIARIQAMARDSREQGAKKPDKKSNHLSLSKEPTITIKQFGPSLEQLASLVPNLARHSKVKQFLARTRHRLLRIDLVDPLEKRKATRPKPSNQFRAIYFD